MEIGIITFHKAENFGSALQAFALAKILEKEHHRVTIIDFVLEKDMVQYKLFRVPLYKEWKRAVLVDLLYFVRNYKRKKAFKNFRKIYLKLTEKTFYAGKDKLDELNQSFDAFVCGSDQIWNLNCTEEFVAEYFLEFVQNEKVKISFSPSMPSRVSKEHYQDLRRSINRIDKVSVRENETIEYLQKEVGVNKEIVHTVDPTLLLSSEEYIKYFDIEKVKTDCYIFVYILGGREQYKSIIAEANKVQKKTGYRMKYVCIRKLRGLKNAEYCLGIGPKQFLEQVYNAEYIITDSFHAVVFSIIFSKKLCAFPRVGSSSRMEELLQAVGMNVCMYNENNDLWMHEDPQNRKMEIIEKLVLPSKEFIAKNLGKERVI